MFVELGAERLALGGQIAEPVGFRGDRVIWGWRYFGTVGVAGRRFG